MRKVLFVKGGQGGGTTPRVSIPMEYIKALEIAKENPEVKITLEGKKIIIEKAEEKKMIVNKDRFASEEQYEIARESIDKAYVDKYGISGIEDMGYDMYEDFVDRLLYNSADDAFVGTDEEIRVGWYDTDMFE